MTPTEWQSSADAPAMAEFLGDRVSRGMSKRGPALLLACWFTRVVLSKLTDARVRDQCETFLAEWEESARSNEDLSDIPVWTVPKGPDGWLPLPSPDTWYIWAMSHAQDIILQPRNVGHWMAYVVLFAACSEDPCVLPASGRTPAQRENFRSTLRTYADAIRTVFPHIPGGDLVTSSVEPPGNKRGVPCA